MPLNAKGKKLKHAMQREYGKRRGERIFYASENKGKIRAIRSRNVRR